MTRVQDVMTRQVSSCRSHQSLNEATRLMWENDCGFIPVVDDDKRVIGTVTDRDALMASYTRGGTLHEIPVGTTMSHEIVSCKPEDSIDHAAGLMRDHKIRRLAVTGPDGRLQGVVSLNDLATKTAPNLNVARTLAAICAPRNRALAAE